MFFEMDRQSDCVRAVSATGVLYPPVSQGNRPLSTELIRHSQIRSSPARGKLKPIPDLPGHSKIDRAAAAVGSNALDCHRAIFEKREKLFCLDVGPSAVLHIIDLRRHQISFNKTAPALTKKILKIPQ